MNDIDAARGQWAKERPQYVEFAKLLEARLRKICLQAGVYAEVSARAKEIHSLAKKLILKKHLTYETLPDKVGVRIIVRYRAELPSLESLIATNFAFDTVDDKASKLGVDKVGYQSIHIDGLRLKDDDPEVAVYPPAAFRGELQVRTLAQHLWSEISHDTFYKNDETLSSLSPDLQRRVNLSAGLVEFADREFDRMYSEAEPDEVVQIYSSLEKLYYSVASRKPNPELSKIVIGLLRPLYEGKTPRQIVEDRIGPLFEAQRTVLETIYQNPDNDFEGTSAFFFQPEAILILDCLYSDRDATLQKWNEALPEGELRKVGAVLGFSFD